MAKILGLSQNTLILLVVLVAGYALYTGMLKLPASTYAPPGNSASCTGLTTAPAMSWGQYWVDPSTNNQKTAAAGWMSLFEPGRAVATLSQTANGGNTTGASLTCGMTYNQVGGDGGATTYYYTVRPVGPVNQLVYSAGDMELTPSGAAVMTFSNASTPEGAVTYISNATFGGTSVGTATVKVHIQFPTNTVFGDKGYVLCFQYNPANVTTVVPSGGVAYNQIGVNGTSLFSLTGVKCYDMGMSNKGQAIDIPLSIQGAGRGIAGASRINVLLLDKTTGLFNGMPFIGTDNGPGSGANSDLGRANIVTANNWAIDFYGE